MSKLSKKTTAQLQYFPLLFTVALLFQIKLSPHEHNFKQHSTALWISALLDASGV